MKILHKKDLPLGGFAGLKEHRLIVDKLLDGRDDTWDGLGNFVYLADAYFQPFGETRMHSHREIDIISIVLEGNIKHKGSLEHGQSLVSGDVQVQRAGGNGFNHNEINPDPSTNRMIQIWVLPENQGEKTSYKLYKTEQNKLTQVYGGVKDQTDTLDSHSILEVGRFTKDISIKKNGDFLAYITEGTAMLNDTEVKDGDLVRGSKLHFKATSDNAQVLIMSQHLNA